VILFFLWLDLNSGISMLQWEKTRKFTGKGGKNNPEIYREGREKISRKFPRQLDCGLARALLDM
jgi:hypothetical protein